MRHELKDILSLLMEECDIDDTTLSRETGIPASTISRMRLNSNANPTASTLRPIAKYFSLSISQLLGDETLPIDRLPGTHNPTLFTSSRMPVLEWKWVMNWVHNEMQDIKQQLYHWISTEKDVGARAFALTIPTDSLGLAFRKDSTIIVDPDHIPSDGDLVLIKSPDDTIFLRQFLIDGNEYYLRSVNPEMKNTNLLTDNEMIIGVIIETRFSLQMTKNKVLQAKTNLLPAFIKILTKSP